MKCPKCNYVSFEYLNSCKKCNLDLTAHKAELGIDFPQYSDLGLLAIMGDAAPAEAVAVEEAVETVEAESAADADILSIGEAIDVDDNSLDLSGGIEPAEDETLTTETEQAVEGLNGLNIPTDETAGDENEDLDLSEIGDDTDTAVEEEAVVERLEADGQTADGQSVEVSASVEKTDPDLSTDEALDALGSTDEISMDTNDAETVEAGTAELGNLGELNNLEINLDAESVEEPSAQEESVAEETAESDTAELDNLDNLDINLDTESVEEPSEQESAVAEETTELGDLDNLDINLDAESVEETSTQEDTVAKEKTEDGGDEELDLSLDDIDLDIDFDDEELLDDNEGKQN